MRWIRWWEWWSQWWWYINLQCKWCHYWWVSHGRKYQWIRKKLCKLWWECFHQTLMSRMSRQHFILVLFHSGIGAWEVAMTRGRTLSSYSWDGPSWWHHTLLGCNQYWYTTTIYPMSNKRIVKYQVRYIWFTSLKTHKTFREKLTKAMSINFNKDMLNSTKKTLNTNFFLLTW